MRSPTQSRRSIQMFTLAILACLILSASTLMFLPEVDAPPSIELSLMGEGTRSVEPGESVEYIIKVQNGGEHHVRSYDLLLSDIPAGWDAELSESRFSLESREYQLTSLKVTSPEDREHDDVAYISVRGEDDSVNRTKKVGTITYTTNSTATVLRDGIETVLQIGDTIHAGDRVWTHEDSVASYKLADEFFSDDIYTILTPETEIHLDYMNSSAQSRADESALDLLVTSVIRGKVFFYQESQQGTRAEEGDPGVHVRENLTTNSQVDVTIPVDGFPADTFFSVEIVPGDDTILTSMYEGSIDITSSSETKELTGSNSIEVELTGDFGSPDPMDFDMVSIEGPATINITVDGKLINGDVNDVPGAEFLTIGGRSVFILPASVGFTIETSGQAVGEYTVSILSNSGSNSEHFTFSTISTAPWIRDTFDWNRDVQSVKFTSNAERTYGLTIEKKTVDKEGTFTLAGIDQPANEEQTFDVKQGTDPEDLDNPDERPIRMWKGDTTVDVGTGMDGDDIAQLFEEAGEEEDEGRKNTGLCAFLTLLLLILIIGLLTITQWYPYYEQTMGSGSAPVARGRDDDDDDDDEEDDGDKGDEDDGDDDDDDDDDKDDDKDDDGDDDDDDDDRDDDDDGDDDDEDDDDSDDHDEGGDEDGDGEDDDDDDDDDDRPHVVKEDEIIEGEAFVQEPDETVPPEIEESPADGGVMEGELVT